MGVHGLRGGHAIAEIRGSSRHEGLRGRRETATCAVLQRSAGLFQSDERDVGQLGIVRPEVGNPGVGNARTPSCRQK